MFPQLGAPIGFILSSGFFLILAETMAGPCWVGGEGLKGFV